MYLFKRIQQVAIFLGFITMTGCALLPGMAMENPGAYNDAPPPNPVTPTIIPITPTMIGKVSHDLNPYHYQIGPGDTLSIIAWSKTGVPVSLTGNEIAISNSNANLSTTTLINPALKATSNAAPTTGGFFVNSDGNVLIPILGSVHVAHLTENETDTLLEQKLALYIKQPMIQTTVISFVSQQVFILGEINGGTSGSTNPNTSSLMSLPITGTPMTLATALAQAGGMNLSTANTRLIYIIRQSSITHPTVYWLNMESPASMLYAENFPLINNDVVYVSTAGIARFNRMLNQILPAIQTVWFTQSVVSGKN